MAGELRMPAGDWPPQAMRLDDVADLGRDDEGPVDDAGADALVDVGELRVSGTVSAVAHAPSRHLTTGGTGCGLPSC